MAFPKEALERLCQENNESALRPQVKPDPRTDLQRRIAHMYDSPTQPRKATVLAEADGSVISGTAGNARSATPLEIRHFLETGNHTPVDQRWIGPQLQTGSVFETPVSQRKQREYYKARREAVEFERKRKRAEKRNHGDIRPQQGRRR